MLVIVLWFIGLKPSHSCAEVAGESFDICAKHAVAALARVTEKDQSLLAKLSRNVAVTSRGPGTH